MVVTVEPLVLADQKAAEARGLVAKEDFDPAIELRIGVHGDEHSDCAGAYAEYAKALLKKVQKESNPFGSTGPKPEVKAAPAGEGEAGPSSGTAEDAAAGDEATGED